MLQRFVYFSRLISILSILLRGELFYCNKKILEKLQSSKNFRVYSGNRFCWEFQRTFSTQDLNSPSDKFGYVTQH